MGHRKAHSDSSEPAAPELPAARSCGALCHAVLDLGEDAALSTWAPSTCALDPASLWLADVSLSISLRLTVKESQQGDL